MTSTQREYQKPDGWEDAHWLSHLQSTKRGLLAQVRREVHTRGLSSSINNELNRLDRAIAKAIV